MKVASLSSGFVCDYAAEDLQFADGSAAEGAFGSALEAVLKAASAKPVRSH